MATSTLLAVAAFSVWTGASFLCHQTAAMFVRTAGSSEASRLPLAVALTLLQTLACYLLTLVHLPSLRWSREALVGWCRVLGHLLATLATNLSLATTHAASALAIKMAEPITTALAQRLLLSTPVSAPTALSLPLVVAGAVVFASERTPGANWSQGALLAFASNLCLAARNTAVKLEQGQGSALTLRPLSQFMGVLLLLLAPVVLYLGGGVVAVMSSPASSLLDSVSTWAAVLAVTSSLMHVMYSYVSAGVVLQHLSVVSHALANVCKRVLVVFLLYVWGKRTASGWNFLGLAISTVGLFIYTAGRLREKAASSSSPSSHLMAFGLGKSKLRRAAALTFFLFASLLFGSGFSQTSLWYPPRQASNYSAPLYNRILPTLSFPSSSGIGVASLTEQTHFRAAASNSPDSASGSPPVPDLSSLLSNPLGANVTSSKLSKSADIIAEAQRIHHTLFSGLVHPAKYALFISMAAFENKGDPAISVGEMLLIRRLGLKVLYYCTIGVSCDKTKFATASSRLTRYADHEVVVLMQGGGNLVTYPYEDIVRSNALEAFSRFKFVLFPQSITLLPTSGRDLKLAERIYRNRPNLTMVLRDPQSYRIARQHFSNGTRLLMAPDMAFQIGLLPRTMFPIYDIVWIRRGDQETSKYSLPDLPSNVTVTVEDWFHWKTPAGNNSMEKAVLMANNGFTFLQRGRVVITDRLHGHILSTLLNIPHVLIDNPYHKLSSYHNTWTRSSEVTLLADSAQDAVTKALYLLDKFKDTLPPILPFMDVRG